MQPKVLTFDIETGAGVNGFKSDLACVLVIGYKWAHEDKARSMSILDYGDIDKEPIQRWDISLLRDFQQNVLSEADILVGHYSTRFDKLFLNGRSLLLGLPPLPPIPHIDTCEELRQFKFSSRKLIHAAKILHLNNQKLSNNWPEAWIEVTRYPEKHIKRLIPYCKGDVLATEELFMRLLPYMRNKGRLHMGGSECCPKCGSKEYQKRGRIITATTIWQRLQCQKCGGWFREGAAGGKLKVKDI